MATTLRSDFTTTPTETYPPLNAPKTAEMRKAERAELKAAKARAREARRQSRRKAVGILISIQPVTNQRADHPGFRERVARRMIKRWYGERVWEVPLVMCDYRYWQARSCGWEPMTRTDTTGAPMGPLADWYGEWWCTLSYETRDGMVRVSRSEGRGVWRR